MKPQASSVKPSSDGLVAKSGKPNLVYVPITIAANGGPSIGSNQGTLNLDRKSVVVWTCNQAFSVWFSDRLVPAVANSKHKNGYAYAVELKGTQLPYTGIPYEYTIETNGGRLDPKVIISS